MRIELNNTLQQQSISPELPAAYSQSFKFVIGQAFVTCVRWNSHCYTVFFPCLNFKVAIGSRACHFINVRRRIMFHFYNSLRWQITKRQLASYTRISDVVRARLIEAFAGNAQECPQNTLVKKCVREKIIKSM